MEGRYLGWVERGRGERESMLEGKCVSSHFLQALIKARKESNSAAISMMCCYRGITIDSAKPTCNYSCFHDQKHCKALKFKCVLLVQLVINAHLGTCTHTYAGVLSCSNHYHLNEAKYSPTPPLLDPFIWPHQ